MITQAGIERILALKYNLRHLAEECQSSKPPQNAGGTQGMYNEAWEAGFDEGQRAAYCDAANRIDQLVKNLTEGKL